MAITELKTTVRKKTKNSLDALNSGNYRTDQQNLPNLNNRKKKKKKYHWKQRLIDGWDNNEKTYIHSLASYEKKRKSREKNIQQWLKTSKSGERCKFMY